MNPQDELRPEQSGSPAHQFPPGLEFLSAFQRADKLEGDEKLALLWTFLQNVRDFGDQLRQHGLDPDRIIAALQPQLEQLGRAEEELAEHENTLLHSMADVAESTRNLVDGLEAVITQAAEERPFDPEVQEWQETLEEMRKQYPKLD
jgi:hypothetical protein